MQRPSVIVGFIEELFEACFEGTAPQLLREDFCGTANLSAQWILESPTHAACAIDHDPEVIEWANERNRKPLGQDATRLQLICNDVLACPERADAIVSLNFSHFIYHDRASLLGYLRHALTCLNDPGLLILDCFGGPGSITPDVDERGLGSFDYLWEQRSFNPIDSRIDCRIHFRFPNGSLMRDAFTYDWRMWSLTELQELLHEAGFSDLGIYFESEEGFVADFDQVNPDAWVAYLVALKS